MSSQPKEQDKGLAHCHYIRQLAHEIWMKENAEFVELRRAGTRIKFDECIRRALLLHRKKLMKNQVDRVMERASKLKEEDRQRQAAIDRFQSMPWGS